MTYDNLDLACANAAAAIFENVKSSEPSEKSINEFLSVLNLNGPSALLLYIRTRIGKDKQVLPLPAQVREQSYHLMETYCGLKSRDRQGISALSTDLPNLLLARHLLHQMLVYLRYHVKTIDDSTPTQS